MFNIPSLFINLEKRTDRKIHIENQLKDFKNVKRIEAIETPENGYLGCALSHIKALEYAKQMGWDEVIIFEDDFEWVDKGIEKLVYPEIDFDVCMISGKINKKEFMSWNYNKVLDGRHTDCYLVKKHFYDKLIDNFRQGYEKLKKNNVHANYIDVYWLSLQKDNTFITPSLEIGRQMQGFSDIQKKNMKRY
jgi:hypothetical protein